MTEETEMNEKLKGNDYPTLEGMSQYIGTKISNAKPMTRIEYNAFRGWKLPDNEEGNDAGYIVQYTDGYISWSPAKQFEEAYRRTDAMNFGLALEAMKDGKKVCRKWWENQCMFLFIVSDPPHAASRSLIWIYRDLNLHGNYEGIDFDPEGDRITLWQATQDDLLAENWQLV